MNPQKYGKPARKSTDSPVKDISWRLAQLEENLAPLCRLIERKIQQVKQGGRAAEYAQRELAELIPAFNAIRAFRDSLAADYAYLGGCYTELEAENKVLRKRDDGRWNRNFRDAFQLVKAIGARIDEQDFETTRKKA